MVDENVNGRILRKTKSTFDFEKVYKNQQVINPNSGKNAVPMKQLVRGATSYYRDPTVVLPLPAGQGSNSLYNNLPHTLEVGQREKSWLDDHRLEAFFLIVILINTIITGIDVDSSGMNDEPSVGIVVAQCLCILVFCAEISILAHKEGWAMFLNNWNVIDFVVIQLCFFEIIVHTLIFNLIIGMDGGTKIARFVSLLRITRLAKPLRNVRHMRQFSTLWKILVCITTAVKSLFWVMFLLFLILLFFAVFTTSLIGKDETVVAVWPESRQLFGRMMPSVLTLFQVVTLDHWSESIARPVMRFLDAPTVEVPLQIIFLLTIGLCTYGLFSVLIAMVVERVQVVTMKSDEENNGIIFQIEQKLCESLRGDFRESDVDNDGDLTEDEFREALKNPEVVRKLMILDIPTNEVAELFGNMDEDDSGSISCFEFISGIVKLKGDARARDLCKVHYFVKYLNDRVRQYEMRVSYMHFKLERAKDSLKACWADFALAASNVERRKEDHVKLKKDIVMKEDMLTKSVKTDVQNKKQWMNRMNRIGSRAVTPEMGTMTAVARKYRQSKSLKESDMLLHPRPTSTPLTSGLGSTLPSKLADIPVDLMSDDDSEDGKPKRRKNLELIARLTRDNKKMKPRMPSSVMNQLIGFDPEQKSDKKKRHEQQHASKFEDFMVDQEQLCPDFDKLRAARSRSNSVDGSRAE